MARPASSPITLESRASRGSGVAGQDRNLIDPQSLMAIRNLELRARGVVEGFWHGLHRSPYHGFSAEFTEYRQYVPGDDLRYLDWRLLARTDRRYLKKFLDETNLRCHLLVDQSRSMTYGSLSYTKAEYAATLAATLAYFLQLQGDAVGLLTFDEQVRDYLPARHRTGHLRRLMLLLERPAAGKATDVSAPLRHIVEIVRKRSLMILISDLLVPAEPLEHNLTALTACGHEVVVFHLLDPAELAFEFDQAVTFRDLESGRDLFLDPACVRDHYRSNLQAHLASLDAVCQRLGIDCHRVDTARPLERALFDFLRGRMQRGKRARTTATRPPNR